MEFHLNPPMKAENEEWPEHWPAWVKKAGDKMEEAENRFPSSLAKNSPLWVDRMSLKIVQYMHPTTKINYEVSGPSFIGSMMGHLAWLAGSEDGLPALTKRYIEASNEYDERLREQLGTEKYEQFIENLESSGRILEFEQMSRSFYRLLSRKAKVMENCFNEAVESPLSEQADFFESYASAIRKPPLDEEGALTMEKSTGVGNIYLVMVLYWKQVQKMDSVTKVHAWLCTIFAPSLVGDLDRIRKMCLRFGIRLTKPGRPTNKKKN